MKVAIEKIDPSSGKSVLSHTVPAERQITRSRRRRVALWQLRHANGILAGLNRCRPVTMRHEFQKRRDRGILQRVIDLG
jgi:hypothetical protein